LGALQQKLDSVDRFPMFGLRDFSLSAGDSPAASGWSAGWNYARRGCGHEDRRQLRLVPEAGASGL
jgi:hypothetical protein